MDTKPYGGTRTVSLQCFEASKIVVAKVSFSVKPVGNTPGIDAMVTSSTWKAMSREEDMPKMKCLAQIYGMRQV
jgi:hypothetical protein